MDADDVIHEAINNGIDSSWCEQCQASFPVEAWEEGEVGCDDCGSHPAIKCPNCGESYDLIFKEFPFPNPFTETEL